MFSSIQRQFIWLLFYILIPACLPWTMTHWLPLQCLKSQESRIRLDDMNMNCYHYNTVFATCHFSMNGVDAVSLHKSWLNICTISVSVFIKYRLHLYWKSRNLEKERFKDTNIRQNTAHVICRENYTVFYLCKWKYKFKMNTTCFCCYLSIQNERWYKDFDWSIMI